MTRILTLFAVASLLALPLHAQEPPSPSDRSEPEAAAPESDGAAKGDVQFQLQADPCDTCKPDFYPVYDCGCRLESLDRWCNCNDSCCVTDEWCEHDCFRPLGTQHLACEDGVWMCNDDYCDVHGTRMTTNTTALRMGVWAVGSQGSKVKTGEYQDLRSSAFYDLDTMMSNGERTLDMNITGLDNEANNVGARYYGPGLTAKFKYQRFLRRLDHDPLYGFDLNTGTPVVGDTNNVVTRDLNVGDDYAIRVQQLDAHSKAT